MHDLVLFLFFLFIVSGETCLFLVISCKWITAKRLMHSTCVWWNWCRMVCRLKMMEKSCFLFIFSCIFCLFSKKKKKKENYLWPEKNVFTLLFSQTRKTIIFKLHSISQAILQPLKILIDHYTFLHYYWKWMLEKKQQQQVNERISNRFHLTENKANTHSYTYTIHIHTHTQLKHTSTFIEQR